MTHEVYVRSLVSIQNVQKVVIQYIFLKNITIIVIHEMS